MTKYTNDVLLFRKLARPDRGNIKFEPGSNLNDRELRAVLWLIKNFGGKITVLTEQSIRTADILLNGTAVEIKHVSGTLETYDTQLRKALRQSGKRGAMMDISDSKFSDAQAINKTCYRMARTGGRFTIVVRNEKLVGYIIKK